MYIKICDAIDKLNNFLYTASPYLMKKCRRKESSVKTLFSTSSPFQKYLYNR